MELIRSYHNLRPEHRGCVLTIGNFDGVHLGHQAVIAQLVQAAQDTDLPCVLMTFEPQPREFFTPHSAPARLTRFREKLEILKKLSVDRILCLRFDQALANLTADNFIERLLVQHLAVQSIIIGDDFHFGHGGKGNFALLKQAGRQYGFQVSKHDTYFIDGERASSSRIRAALAVGDFATATMLLGRSYCMSGRVVYGDQLGRTIGFPTANIMLGRRCSPLTGAYAVRIHGIHPQPLPGMANIGIRPTVGGIENRLEVHIFDFKDNIYGHHVKVEFLAKIRPEQRFASIEALKQQLQSDAAMARLMIAEHSSTETNNFS